MYSAVVCGAGSGKRTNLSFNKIFYLINGKQLILYTLQPFLIDPDCKEIILVVSQSDFCETKKLIHDDKVKIVLGGATRQDSVFSGLKYVTSEIVFIHDGARPNIHPLYIEKCKESISKYKAITLAIPVKDTLKSIKDNIMGATIDRDSTVKLQTPQVFYTADILSAHLLAINNNQNYTDDATLYATELMKDVTVISGDEYNIKATTMVDLLILEEILCTK